MEIKTLEKAMHEFVKSKGWYEPNSPKQQSFRNLAISLALESAEVLEHFQWTEEINDRDELAGELADVMLYLLQLASLAEINLSEAVMNKLKINYHREWDDTK